MSGESVGLLASRKEGIQGGGGGGGGGLRRRCGAVGARLLLRHAVDTRPAWHVARLLLGAAACIVLARTARCSDAFSAVFTFFLCVSAFGGSTWLSVKEVLLGSLIGSLFGSAFALITTAIDPVYALSWHCVWLAVITVVLSIFTLCLSETGLAHLPSFCVIT